jgi:outer membrane protein assembly factor BamB
LRAHARRVSISIGVIVALLVPAAAHAEWRQFHNTASRRGLTNHSGITRTESKHLGVAWNMSTGGTVKSSPVIANGILYIGSDDGKLWAINASTGAEVWSASTGDSIRSSPAVVGGIVYIGSNDGKVYAFDASNGNSVWTTTLGGWVTAAPLVVGGRVFIGTRGGFFYSLDADTGDVKWSHQIWDVWGSAAYKGGLVYVGSDQYKLYAYHSTSGKLKWSKTLDGRVRGVPSISGGSVFVGDDEGFVSAFDRTSGHLRWSTRAAAASTNTIVRSAPAIGRGLVFVDTGETTPMDGHVVAFAVHSGKEIWRSHMADYATSSPALANGVLYVGSYDTRLYAYDADNGKELWTSGWGTLDGGVSSSPALSGSRVYVGVGDGSVYAFEP